MHLPHPPCVPSIGPEGEQPGTYTMAEGKTAEQILEEVNVKHLMIYDVNRRSATASVGEIMAVGPARFQSNNGEWHTQECIEVHRYCSYSNTLAQLHNPAWTDPNDNKQVYTTQPNKRQKANPVTEYVTPEEVFAYNITLTRHIPEPLHRLISEQGPI